MEKSHNRIWHPRGGCGWEVGVGLAEARGRLVAFSDWTRFHGCDVFSVLIPKDSALFPVVKSCLAAAAESCWGDL